MKTIQTLLLLAGLAMVSSLLAADSDTNAPVAEAPAAPAATGAPPTPDAAPPPSPPATNAPPAEAMPVAAAPVEPAEATARNGAGSTVTLPNGEIGLRLNFRGAPLEMVLNYLSEAAGFIIVLDTQVKGKVDVWSNTPLSKDEAV